MATRQTSSKNSALKHTPKTSTVDLSRFALYLRKEDRNRVKRGDLSFAREVERLCLTVRYLRAGGFRAEAREFSKQVMYKSWSLRSMSETKAQALVRQAEQAKQAAKKAAKLAAK
jgi:hypothetical protein